MHGFVELVVLAIAFETFPLIHHLALATRLRLAAQSGLSEYVKTQHTQLLILQVFAIGIAVLTVMVRVSRGLPMGSIGWTVGWLFSMVFAAGIYWRYPQAAPVNFWRGDWRAGFSPAARYSWAALASVLSVTLAGILIFSEYAALSP